MAFWGSSTPKRDLDAALAGTLVDQSSRTREKLQAAQEALRGTLQEGEDAIVSGARRSGGTVVVVTDRRVLEFKKGRLEQSIDANRVRSTEVMNFGGTWVVDVVGPMMPLEVPDERAGRNVKSTIDLLFALS